MSHRAPHDDVVADRVMRGQWAWGPVGIRGSELRRLVVWPPYEDSPLQFDLDKEGRLVGFVRTPQGTNRDGAKRSAYVLEDVCDPTPLPPPQRVTLWPRQHHITPPERLKLATAAIGRELRERCAELRANGHGMEAERLEQRTNADVALLNELGWCPGAEHYSRHLGGRAEGEPPVTLLDYLNFNTSDPPTRPPGAGAGADARARATGVGSSSRTSPTSCSRSSARCTAGTGVESSGLWLAGTGCPPRWITARSRSKSSGSACRRRCSCPPPRVTSRTSGANRAWWTWW